MPSVVLDKDSGNTSALPPGGVSSSASSVGSSWTTERDAVRRARARAWWSLLLRAAAFLAGFATAFTVSLVGEMPVGEVILLGVAAVAGFGIVSQRHWPGPLMAGRLFHWFLLAQAVAFFGYILSDLARGSVPHDALRGWARMLFLAVDLVAVAYLFDASPRNFVALGVVGMALGNSAETLLHGALFGDTWKFGYGGPLTLLVFLSSPMFGMGIAQVAIAALGCLHFVMGYRSLGAECLLVAALLTVLRFPRRVRVWALPVFVGGITLAAVTLYVNLRHEGENSRSSRSDVERSAMMRAAWDGFRESPLIGQGSWFSRSQVMDNFLALRTERAQLAEVGGFATDAVEEGLSVHSQLLVALAEGGILGGCFFLLYGAGLLWALGYCILQRPLDRLSPVYLLSLASALSNLLFSPFSGAHRVGIALAVGLVLLLARERREAARWPDVARAVAAVRRRPSSRRYHHHP